MDRRQFIRTGFLAAAGITLGSEFSESAARNVSLSSPETDRVKRLQALVKNGSGFCMWQLGTQNNLIGNSYVFVTNKGRVIVIDGGYREDELYLRGFLAALGNKVDSWFVSHPHVDHMGSLTNILNEPRGITVDTIYHSRFPESLIQSIKVDVKHCHDFYAALDNCKETKVVDVQQPGFEGHVDGFNFKVLSVQDPTITRNAYNNNSMILLVWDKLKRIVFLGDMGQEAGLKILNSPYKRDLDCNYLQMAHHGQWACNEDFYKTIKFRACLWSTPRKFWENNDGKGPGTSFYEVPKTLEWMNRKGIKEHHVSCMGLWKLE